MLLKVLLSHNETMNTRQYLNNPSDPQLTGLVDRFVNQLAQCRRLNLKVLGANAQQVLIELPYDEQLVGDPNTGVLHGGVITTLMDTASGSAVVSAIKGNESFLELCPTLDLRVDYMKPAKPGKSVFGLVECYKLAGAIAFTRGVAFQESIEHPIAHCVGSFMRIGPDLVTDDFRQALGE